MQIATKNAAVFTDRTLIDITNTCKGARAIRAVRLPDMNLISREI